MGKTIWSDDSLGSVYKLPDAGELAAARGVVIGLAISQVFWIALAWFLL